MDTAPERSSVAWDPFVRRRERTVRTFTGGVDKEWGGGVGFEREIGDV